MSTKTKAVQLGQVVFTMGVSNVVYANKSFSDFLVHSLIRHTNHDWGDLCDDDKEVNELALQEGSRLLSGYDIPPSIEIHHQKIWIITEWSREVTTILFPSEY